MDASDRVNEVYRDLVSLGRDCVDTFTTAEQVVFYVVSTRSQKDTHSFAHACECLKQSELKILFNGLKQIDEGDLANEFRQVFQVLRADGFYAHRDWNKVSDNVKREINEIGTHIGDRLRNLDDKLAALLDDPSANPPAED